MPQLRAHTSATCLETHWPAAFFFAQKPGLSARASAQGRAEGDGGGRELARKADGTLAFALMSRELASKADTPPTTTIKAAPPQTSTSQQELQLNRAARFGFVPPTCWYFRGRRRLRVERAPSSSNSSPHSEGSSIVVEVAARASICTPCVVASRAGRNESGNTYRSCSTLRALGWVGWGAA